MIRLFVPDDLGSGAEIVLGREASHYIANVMRQIVGGSIALFNGRDGEWKALITETGKRAVRLRAAGPGCGYGPPRTLRLRTQVVRIPIPGGSR